MDIKEIKVGDTIANDYRKFKVIKVGDHSLLLQEYLYDKTTGDEVHWDLKDLEERSYKIKED